MATFFKVKLEYWNNPVWMEYQSGRLVNWLGGGFPFNPAKPASDVTVLDKAEAGSFSDLDWTGTCFDNPNERDGWLDPNGRFWGCEYASHDVAAQLLFKVRYGSEAMDRGYLRIHGTNLEDGKPFYMTGPNVKLTTAQINWLKERGMKILNQHLP